MKKNKGFTLIELLAVIVVLVILLIIAVPKILNVIEEAERKAFKESAELMAHTARVQYDSKEVTGEAQTIPEEGLIYTYENNEQSNIDEVGELKFSGDKPLSGSITLTQNKKTIITELVSKNGKWCAVKTQTGKVKVGSTKDDEFFCDAEDMQDEEFNLDEYILFKAIRWWIYKTKVERVEKNLYNLIYNRKNYILNE